MRLKDRFVHSFITIAEPKLGEELEKFPWKTQTEKYYNEIHNFG